MVIPNHIECCTRPVIEWTKENIPNVRFNLMFQQSMHYRTNEFPRIDRALTVEECQKAVDILKKSGLADIIV